jgi:hypothetical protein
MADGDAPDIGSLLQDLPMGNTTPPQSMSPGMTPQAQAPQQQQQPIPKPGGMPLLLQYISGMVKGGQQGPQGQPAPSRGDMTMDFLGHFLTNMASGLAQAGHGPGANLRGFAGGVAAPYQQQMQQYQLGQQQQQQQAQIQEQQARAQLTQAQAEQMKNVVQTPYGPMSQSLAAKVFPAAISAQGRVGAAQVAGQARVQSAQIGQGMSVDVPQELQEQFGAPAKFPLKQLNALESAANKPLTTVQGATDAYQLNKQTGQVKALGIGSGRIAATMARPVQVADPNNPGGVKYMPAGEAMRTGAQAASSADVKVPASVLKDFTSGKSAQTLNSFNTATEHLKLLDQLGDALNNGNVPIINALGNRFATATGGAAPTSFNMAKQAVAGEVAKTFKGQATEGEIASINSVINAAQSPTQLKGAIGTALSLMESKRQALMEQYNQGIKKSPAFQSKGGSKVDSLVGKYGGQQQQP